MKRLSPLIFNGLHPNACVAYPKQLPEAVVNHFARCGVYLRLPQRLNNHTTCLIEYREIPWGVDRWMPSEIRQWNSIEPQGKPPRKNNHCIHWKSLQLITYCISLKSMGLQGELLHWEQNSVELCSMPSKRRDPWALTKCICQHNN